ncbi:MAG: FAD-binding protein, partial [Bacillota bacterium]|nr:FAD-binding protein [Bacillota bacterium]
MQADNVQFTDTEVLVIGGGLAAIKASRTCGAAGIKTVMAIKGRLCSGASFYPFTSRLGCLAPRLDDPDDACLFLEEISAASQGMNDPELGRIYIEEIHDRIAELPDMGVEPHLMEMNRVACFAERERALYYWEDWGGTRERVRARLAALPSVTILEQWTALELLQQNGRVCGAIFAGPDNQLLAVRAGAVILATGGFGDLYKHNLNTADVGGDGHMLAYDAGASLGNLEFIQFIPGYMTPRYKVLFGEPTLRYCTAIRGTQGQDLLAGLLPDGLTAGQCFLERSRHGPFTTSDRSRYFDQAIMGEILATGQEDGVRIFFNRRIIEDCQDGSSWYVNWLKEKMQIDLMQDRLSIAPFAHASNGGIVITAEGWTGVPGLFAAGEVAGTMHGADRIGGCATGNCLVFGRRAALGAIDQVRQSDRPHIGEKTVREQIAGWTAAAKADSLSPGDVLFRVKETLWKNASILRSETLLRQALQTIDLTDKQYDLALALQRSPTADAFRAKNALRLARLLVVVMLERKESRGPHFRPDYPERDNTRFGMASRVNRKSI